MSTFVVSARKYRPARFEDVVGQEHITNTLKNALRNDHLAHAFLFCGPRGVGKTTCARILAKVMNCQNLTPDFEACNECSSCKSFNENASFNITELDAASNNSVEHIRALIEQVRFQPQQGRYKIFIIDEVHMLSQAAFNAFLKTLEEPPPYAVFILATTEKHKIIPTILSRCQIFDFKRIQVPDIVSHLEGICAQEGIQAEPDALHVIAQKSDGALRDALSIFDRMVASSDQQVTYAGVIANLNVLDYDYYFRLVDALLIEDMPGVLLLFDDILNKGFEADTFINGLAEHLRNLLMCKDPETIPLLEVSGNLRERYQRQAQAAPNTFLLTALNLANDCDINYRMARNKRLHVEMTLIKMTFIHRAVNADQLAPVSNQEKKTPDLNGITPKPAAAPAPQSPDPTPPVADPNQLSILTTETPAPSPEPDAPAPTPAPAKAAGGKPLDAVRHLAATPRLSRRDLLKELEAEHQAVEKPPVKELTLENLRQEWAMYIHNLEQESTRNMLKGIEVQLNGLVVTATVSSGLVENTLRQERKIMECLREAFGEQSLELQIEVVKTEVPEAAKPARSLSDKDKLLKLYEKNPLVKDMAERFNLKFDRD